VELFVLRGERHVLVQADAQDQVRSAVLGAAFTTIAGPRLAVSWKAGPRRSDHDGASDSS
jgi:hypothetical protein